LISKLGEFLTANKKSTSSGGGVLLLGELEKKTNKERRKQMKPLIDRRNHLFGFMHEL
jgi:hypothetical protein